MWKEQLLARASVGALAGIGAGLVVGIFARAAMRMVALGVPDGIGQLPRFTAEGTVALLITLALVAAPFGVVYQLIAGRIPGPGFTRGPLFGALCLLVFGPVFFLGNPDEFLTRSRVVLFALLFPLFGLALGLTIEPSQRIAAGLPAKAQATLAIIALAGGGLAAFAVVVFTLQSIVRLLI